MAAPESPAGHTSARCELAALEWKDVYLDRGVVSVRQALDLRTGEAKGTKTGHSREVPIHPALAPLLATMRPADGAGRVVTSEHANRKAEGGMPPLEDLAATLRDHLWRADVRRADLHEERPNTKRVTFYDLRATGITWEVLAGAEHLRLMQRAATSRSAPPRVMFVGAPSFVPPSLVLARYWAGGWARHCLRFDDEHQSG